MSTIAKATDAPSNPAPVGNHRAMCYGVVDLGTHSFTYQGSLTTVHKIMLMFELSDELMEDGRPFSVSKDFTLSLSEKSNLLPFLNSWRGKAFTVDELKGWDIANVLTAPALLNVIHKQSKKGKTFADIAAASPLPKGMGRPEPHNTPVHYQVEDGTPPESLPGWVRKKILESQEFQGTNLADIPAPARTTEDDLADVPF
jgi:hypothetical protein